MVRKRPVGAPCGAFGGTHGAVGALRMAGMPGRAGHDGKGAWSAGRYRRRGVQEGTGGVAGRKGMIWKDLRRKFGVKMMKIIKLKVGNTYFIFL